MFRSVIPEGATFNSLSTRLWWTSGGTTGDVVWCVQYEEDNGYDIDSDGFTAAVCGTFTCAGVCGGVTGPSIITSTSEFLSGLTSGDPYRVKIYRAGASAADTMTTDAQLMWVEIRGA